MRLSGYDCAGFYDMGASLVVAANGLRLLRVKP
jgi:hypothetical protein